MNALTVKHMGSTCSPGASSFYYVHMTQNPYDYLINNIPSVEGQDTGSYTLTGYYVRNSKENLGLAGKQ